MVKGTLKKALEPYLALTHPLARAMYIMFVVSEVHPFEDGNGRIARIMMNAELVKAQYKRIIIPTIYREDYLLALRKLSRQQIPDAYVRMLDRAQAFSAWLNPQTSPEQPNNCTCAKLFRNQKQEVYSGRTASTR